MIRHIARISAYNMMVKTIGLGLMALLMGASSAKIDVTLRLEEREGEHIFIVEGSTDVPVGTILRARIYAVSVMDDFHGGEREDEEPLLWEGDPDALQPPYQDLKVVEGGKFCLEVNRFRRKPWSIRYRARVHYLPDVQEDATIIVKLGESEFSGAADLAAGTPENLSAELEARTAEVGRELEDIWRLFDELRREYMAQQVRQDLKAWKEWKSGWYARVSRIAENNKQRYGIWAVWMERQSKMRVAGCCELLRLMLISCTEQLGGKEDAMQNAQGRFDGFTAYYEEAIEAIGVDAPLDLQALTPLVEAYEKGLAPLRAWIAEGEGTSEEAYDVARRQCNAAIMRIVPLVQKRKRVYGYVKDQGQLLNDLLDQVRTGAGGDALKAALAAHDQASAQFRKLAGLK